MNRQNLQPILEQAGFYVGEDGKIWPKNPGYDITEEVNDLIQLIIQRCIVVSEPSYDDGDIAAIRHHNDSYKIKRYFGVD